MEYFVTHMDYKESRFGGTIRIMQLVKASNMNNAKKKVKEDAINRGVKPEWIFGIIVQDTLVGD